jgi:hypothetical protein
VVTVVDGGGGGGCCGCEVTVVVVCAKAGSAATSAANRMVLFMNPPGWFGINPARVWLMPSIDNPCPHEEPRAWA